MNENKTPEVFKDLSQRELGELYHNALKEGDEVVARLINQIWLLQDLLRDEKDRHYKTQVKLHEMRSQKRAAANTGLSDKEQE